jgi:Protein of unknown function (DUF2911)
MRAVLICTILLSDLLLAPTVTAFQAALNADTDTAVCTFEDGKQVTARYDPISIGHNDSAPSGKVLTPGGSAMTFFTETDIIVGNTAIPPGGYTMYVIPGKKDWTLIISKNVKVDAKYDEKQDLARTPMETGQLTTPDDKFSIYFGHTGPKRCEVDVNYGKTRAWAEFRQK